MTSPRASLLAVTASLALFGGLAASPAGRAADTPDVPDGLRLLLEEPLSVAIMTLDDLERLWTVWEPEERAVAEAADENERRSMTFARYGLIERRFAGAKSADSAPLGYAVDREGNLYPNCLACHGGKVAKQVVPGLANTDQDLSALADDLAALRAVASGGDPESARRGATLGFPLNFTRGSTNATMYSILLGAMRDAHLDLVFPPELSQPWEHNSIDAPPWWHFKRKSRIYWDGMAPKTTRTLMQFAMAPGLSGERIRSWENEFERIRAYIETIEPPPYPFPVDDELAERGRGAFERVCSECHGSYGAEPTYPERTVALSLVGTDPVRLGAIHRASKEKYNQSWFSSYGEHPVLLDTPGYVAPPLDGIWASAPYLHNASVPTLWHVLHPDARPGVWRRRDGAHDDGYDRVRVGLAVEELDAVPEGLSPRQQREYFDSALPSHSTAGHRFPEVLSETERVAVLEYLKTL